MRFSITAYAGLVAGLIASQPGPALANPLYAVEGLVIGEYVRFDSAAYRQYRCEASSQFRGFFWCTRRVNTQNRNGNFVKTYSMAHDAAGRVAYINLSFDPAFFNFGEAEREVRRLNQKFGETARMFNMPARGDMPTSLIAAWGGVELERLSADGVALLARGDSPNAGILMDHIGQLRQSARLGLSVFRLTGQAGYVWSASYDANGIGHLRLTAIDPALLSPPVAPRAAPPVVASDPPDAPAETRLSPAERIEALERLGKLKQSGVLSESEFEREKQKILSPENINLRAPGINLPQEFQGRWASQKNDCGLSEKQIADKGENPFLTIGQKTINAHESECRLTKLTRDPSAVVYKVSLACNGEGETWSEEETWSLLTNKTQSVFMRDQRILHLCSK